MILQTAEENLEITFVSLTQEFQKQEIILYL